MSGRRLGGCAASLRFSVRNVPEGCFLSAPGGDGNLVSKRHVVPDSRRRRGMPGVPGERPLTLRGPQVVLVGSDAG